MSFGMILMAYDNGLTIIGSLKTLRNNSSVVNWTPNWPVLLYFLHTVDIIKRDPPFDCEAICFGRRFMPAAFLPDLDFLTLLSFLQGGNVTTTQTLIICTYKMLSSPPRVREPSVTNFRSISPLSVSRDASREDLSIYISSWAGTMSWLSKNFVFTYNKKVREFTKAYRSDAVTGFHPDS